MAASQALEAQPAAAQRPVRLERLEEIVRTCRLETAPAARAGYQRQHGRDQKLIAANEEAKHDDERSLNHGLRV